MNHSATEANRQSNTVNTAGLEQWLTKLRGNPLVPLLVAGAAVIAIIIALLMWAGSPEYRVLYSNLSEADGGRIIAELDRQQIPYQFSTGGQNLLVPSDQVHSLRLRLAEQGLPQGSNVGFSLMDNQAFGISQFAEQVNFQRALEGELSSSIESLGPVASARVHLAMAKPSVFIRDSKPAKASVVLNLHPGRALGEGQVNAIIHMISSSVPELITENVTLVDQHGNLLSRPQGMTSDLDGTQLSYIEEVERSYQQRIERILAPILGAQNVRAQVAAQLDFSSREETSERYGPNQAPNQAAVRSAQHSASYTDGEGLIQGIPGALSNVPPGVAPSPIELQPNAEADDAEPVEPRQPPSQQNIDNVINYEVDRNIAHIQYRRGQIKRLSVAVVVNYREQLDENGVLSREPLSDTELDHISRLVRQAMGYSDTRGDQLEVVNSPFIELDSSELEQPWWESALVHQLLLPLGRYLLVGLAALLLYFLIVRPLLGRYTNAARTTPEQPRLHVQVGDDDSGTESELTPGDTYEKVQQRRRKAHTHEQHVKRLQEMAKDDPRMVAMIIRSWMDKNE
ncbi:flagellar basal-body MS-ring/collar protein FliF [Thiopseudomonas alkaliphila]|uniref:flagellar basal-body MS-ring/collar protein FliF n=1 Tax=Thiopseudomonas alkaliphila TaxID=1697053 RepID=UPI0035715D0F